MKVTRHRKANPLRHKIHMPDGIWTYQIGCKVPGYGGGATIRSPDCTLTGKIDMSELTGWSWSALEREGYKSPATLPQVKPGDIRLLIQNIQKGVYEAKTTSTENKARVSETSRVRIFHLHREKGAIGSDVVIANGGKVVYVPFVKQMSTTGTIQKLE